jgi:hypothetical protein
VQGTVRRAVLAILLLVLLTPAWAATGKAPKHTRHSRHGRRIRWNPLFRPSRESLLKQNAEIDRLELPRIQDDDELEELKARQELVPIRASEYLRFDPRLDPARRYCRPWTRDFLEDLGQAFYKEFGTSIQVNSAVRTAKIQKKQRRRNRNAAPADGETASSHLAGVTVDIQRRGLSRTQVKWMQHYLLKQRVLGLIEPEEERRQWVFHVMVSDRYTDWRQARNAQIVESIDDSQVSAASGLIQLDASQ